MTADTMNIEKLLNEIYRISRNFGSCLTPMYEVVLGSVKHPKHGMDVPMARIVVRKQKKSFSFLYGVEVTTEDLIEVTGESRFFKDPSGQYSSDYYSLTNALKEALQDLLGKIEMLKIESQFSAPA